MDNNKFLPPLPASDPESIARNRYDGFYQVKSKDFWQDAEVNLHKVDEFSPCQHFFQQEGSYVKCRMCNAGFFGPGITAQDGKLLVNNIETVF